MTLMVKVNVAVGVRAAGLSVSQTAATDLLGTSQRRKYLQGLVPPKKRKQKIASEMQWWSGECLIDIEGQKG